jgi:large subunit ribosomal protein L4e
MDCPELPLVADCLNTDTTAGLLAQLNSLGAKADLQRVRSSKKSRAGQGKYRNARFTMRRGPLVVYGDKNPNLLKTARNLPGVDVCNVNRLNLLQLAPGGQVGRFIIFTRDAFESLDKIFGTYSEKATEKSGYQLQRNIVDCADLARIINSDQVQSKLREIRTSVRAHDKTKKNPLKNKTMMQKLNPNFKAQAAADVKAEDARKKTRATAIKEKRSKKGKLSKAKRTERFNGLADGLETSFKEAHQVILDEIRDGRIEESASEEEEDDE